MDTSSSSSQDKILYQIKRLGPQTVKSLADKLGVTTMAVRQHLALLEGEELIESLPEQAQPRGRPVKPWQLTSKGHSRFPDAHAQVTLELITSVRDELGKPALDALIARRTRETLANYLEQLKGEKTLADRINRLAAIRTQEGYMAEVIPDGGDFLLLENHCPICIAATECQGFCQSELEVFRAALGNAVTVTREDHLLNGARRCSYRVSRAASY